MCTILTNNQQPCGQKVNLVTGTVHNVVIIIIRIKKIKK
jgi:hypothetical protein